MMLGAQIGYVKSHSLIASVSLQGRSESVRKPSPGFVDERGGNNDLERQKDKNRKVTH